ncbi:MAG: hypothetical protein JKY52_20785 [Flavobacteriales bacterium]|nr:hypothetical protein [Flavobacteriales bacterium]
MHKVDTVRFILYLLLSTMLPEVLIAQDTISDYAALAQEDMGKVNATYTSIDKLSMDVTYSLYPSYFSPAPTDISKGFYKKQGDMFQSSIMGVETMQNEKYRIVTDEAAKLLVVSEVLPTIAMVTPVKIDSALRQCSAISYRESANGQKIYTLNFDKGVFDFQSLEIFINPKSYLLDQINIYFGDAINIDPNDLSSAKQIPMVQIVYSNVNQRPKFRSALFSEHRYVKDKNGAYVASANYPDYEVINLISNKY